MKVKIEKVNVGVGDYDSIVVSENGNKKEIIFNKDANVSKYEGKDVDLTFADGRYAIKEFVENKNPIIRKH